MGKKLKVIRRGEQYVILTPTRSILVPKQITVAVLHEDFVEHVFDLVGILLKPPSPRVHKDVLIIPRLRVGVDAYEFMLYRKGEFVIWTATHLPSSGKRVSNVWSAAGVLSVEHGPKKDHLEAHYAAAQKRYRGRGIYPAVLRRIRDVFHLDIASAQRLSPANVAQWTRHGVWSKDLERFVFTNPPPSKGLRNFLAWAAMEAVPA
jgi:hypothetical protein